MSLAPGSSLGPYRIIGPLGRGGMAAVYKAYEASLDRFVALKILPTEFLHTPDFAARFKREAHTVAKLEHPHIVPIYAHGIDEGIPWMAMRLVEGGAVSALLKTHVLQRATAAKILRGVAGALDYAHTQGVVHRDVKPQNILLDRDDHVYLADFGIARIVEGSTSLTHGFVGTPHYMAPEQARGQAADSQSDIYALGIVAFEMFTGHVPFTADTPVAVLMKHLLEPIPLPPTDVVSPGLLRPLLKCLDKDPAARWQSATAFVTALEQAEPPSTSPAGEPVSVAEVPVPGIRGRARVRRLGFALVLAAVLALAMYFGTRAQRGLTPSAPPLVAAAAVPRSLLPSPTIHSQAPADAKERVISVSAPPSSPPTMQPKVSEEPPSVTAARQACDSGDFGACSDMGVFYSHGLGGLSKDEQKAAAFLHRSCEGGNSSGCYNLALAYQSGTGVQKSLPRAVSLYAGACDQSNMAACSNLALLYSSGQGVQKDLSRAAALLEKACAGNAVIACGNLGVMYASGDGVDKDVEKAVVLFKRACDAGGAHAACFNAGRAYELGEGIAPDLNVATTYYKRSCDRGNVGGCYKAQQLGLLTPSPWA